MRKGYLYVLMACFLLVGCQDDFKLDDVSDIAMFVSPESTVELVSGEKEQYELSLQTPHEYVRGLKARSFDKFNGEKIVLDTVFVEKKQAFKYIFVYTAPEVEGDDVPVALTFTAESSEGAVCEVERKVSVKGRYLPIDEKEGIVLYLSGTQNPDALCFTDATQTFVREYAPESVLADVYVSPGDIFAWESASEAKFVRSNNFNYSNATATSVTEFYRNSIRSDFVADIKSNDVIIVGHGDEAEGVFYVRNVYYDAVSPEKSYMQVAFKEIKR